MRGRCKGRKEFNTSTDGVYAHEISWSTHSVVEKVCTTMNPYLRSKSDPSSKLTTTQTRIPDIIWSSGALRSHPAFANTIVRLHCVATARSEVHMKDSSKTPCPTTSYGVWLHYKGISNPSYLTANGTPLQSYRATKSHCFLKGTFYVPYQWIRSSACLMTHKHCV